MLSRRALVGRLAAGAAVAVAWAAGGVRPGAAAVRSATKTLPDAGGGEGRREAAEACSRAPESIAARPLAPQSIDTSRLASVSAPPPWELLRPLRVGTAVGHGWRVADLSGVEDGACVLTLRNGRGRVHRVHLCRNAGRPRGLVYTKRLDMVVMNGGRGDLPTEEGLAQAVAAVAHVLAANEGRRQHQHVVDRLVPHAQRLQMFAAVGDGRLR